MSSWGIQAAESRSRSWSNFDWSSPGMTADSARRPWTRALKRTPSLPAEVWGPVDFFALLRLARIGLIVAIVTFSTEQSQFGAGQRVSRCGERQFSRR